MLPNKPGTAMFFALLCLVEHASSRMLTHVTAAAGGPVACTSSPGDMPCPTAPPPPDAPRPGVGSFREDLFTTTTTTTTIKRVDM